MQIRLVVVLLTGFVVSAPAARSASTVHWDRFYDRQGNQIRGRGQDAADWDTLYWKGAGCTTNLYVSDKSANPVPELQRAAAFRDSEDVVAMDPAGDFIYEVTGDTIRKISTADGSSVDYPMLVGSSRGICGVESSYIYIPDGFSVYKYTTSGEFVNATLTSTNVGRYGFAVCNDTVWASSGDSIFYGYACPRFNGGSVSYDAAWNTTITGVPMNIAFDGTYYYVSSGGSSPSSFIRFYRDRTVYSTGFAGLDSRGVMCAKIPLPAARLLAPNGGETWQSGVVHDILWTSTNSTTDSLVFRPNCCEPWSLIGTQSPPTGTLHWTVPDTSSGLCQVQVYAIGPAGIDSSASASFFTILPRLALRLSRPNGGETLHAGNPYNVVWNSVGSFRDSIIYSTDDGATWIFIAKQAGPGGSFIWDVPATPSTACRLAVFSISPDTLVTKVSAQTAGKFIISLAPPRGWSPAPPVPYGARRKPVKDGGALAYGKEVSDTDTGHVYALKGNNTYEFCRYNTIAHAWAARESIPAINRNNKKKGVKKGSSLTMGTDGRLYATKGNNTLDFWQFDPAARGWTQLTDVPAGAKACKEGTSSAAVESGGAGHIYLLKGSGTNEFYSYNASTGAWDVSLPAAPGGASGKGYKNGSSIAYDGGDTIYCLKGSYNEFAAYSISGKTWVTRNPLPWIAPPGTKKTKVKDGSQIAADRNGIIYALKGGNSNELWQYRCSDQNWYACAPMTAGSRRVKGGGALAYAANFQALFALRGNGTWEFWVYGPDVFAPGDRGTLTSAFGPAGHAFMRVAPSPVTGAARISFALPAAGEVNLRLYELTGALTATLAQGFIAAGRHEVTFNTDRLARGVYLLRLESGDYRTTQKLVVE